jgi:hypothetical protein
MTEIVKLSDIILDDRNANEHTERGEYAIRKSLEKFGFAEAGTLDKNNRVIGGNLRTEAAADVLAAEDAIVVDVDGTRPVYIRRKDLDLDTAQGRELALALNRVPQMSIRFDPLVLEDYYDAGVDMKDWFHTGELREMGLDIDVAGRLTRPDYESVIAEMMGDVPMPEGVPDTLWPTDNDWGIPTLDIERQADAFDVPIERWGSQSRKGKVGTWHFYTDDYRFEGVWAKPDQLVQAGCVNAVEPNFSVYDQFPRAVALWATFRKRWLARYWQSRGVRIFVDLNVARPYDDLNLLGVPMGWRAYATRGYTERIEALDEELAIARAHAGTDSVLFMCYGGGDAISEWCKQNGAVWVASDFNRKRGKYLNSYVDEV